MQHLNRNIEQANKINLIKVKFILFDLIQLIIRQPTQIQMIKQLQSRILKLEQALQSKQKDYLKKKQHYEKIIEQLQQDNQKLKNVISQLNQSKQQIQQPFNKSLHQPLEQRELSDYEFKEQHPNQLSYNDYSELISENNLLKQQIATISVNFQKQIEELTRYFEKIKSSSRLAESYTQDAANAKQVSGKIAVLMRAYEDLLKNYDSQKQKFTQKIEQLSKYFELTNEKNRSLVEEKIRLQKRLKNSDQRLRLLRQNLGL